MKYSLTVWLFLVRLSLNPCSTVFLESVATLRSCARSLVYVLLKPKSAWNQKSCSLGKLVLASAYAWINFFFRPKVDKGVSAWLLITREATFWSVVGLLTSSTMCETLFHQEHWYFVTEWLLPWWVCWKQLLQTLWHLRVVFSAAAGLPFFLYHLLVTCHFCNSANAALAIQWGLQILRLPWIIIIHFRNKISIAVNFLVQFNVTVSA